MNVEQLGLIDRPPAPEETRRQMRAYTVRYVALVALVSLVIGGLIGRFAWQDLGAETALAPPSGWRTGALPLAADGAPQPTPTLAPLQVYVSGAVVQPQVVEVPGGSLLAAALAAAGGPAPEADLDSINLAAPLANHQHVHIPARAAPPTPPAQPRGATPTAAPTNDAAPNARVNLNTATFADLLTLPGIGETRAQAILAYRAEHGNFERIEDIQRVSGIGPSIYEKLAPLITVGP